MVKVRGWPAGVGGMTKPESPPEPRIGWVAVTVTWVPSATPTMVIEV